MFVLTKTVWGFFMKKINLKNLNLSNLKTDLTKKENKINLIFGICLVVVIIIAVVCAAVLGGGSSEINFHVSGDYAEGIDVSSHNGSIDWETVADNTDFAIIRAGYRGYGENGTLVQDEYFDENIEAATDAGVMVGVYFYSQATTVEEAEEEADFVLEILDGVDLDLPVFIDFEFPYNDDGVTPIGRMYSASLSADGYTELINAFCTKIEDAGYYHGVYSSSNVYNIYLTVDDFIDGTYIWVADYNSTISFMGEYDVLQYSKYGSCEGVNSSYVDVNRWYVD